MDCVNHPDIAALATCSVCGSPLCSLCARFYQGRAYCAEHAANRVSEGPPPSPMTGSFPAPPEGAAAPPPGVLLPGPSLAPQGTARLEPLPMEQRPGWTQESLVRPPSGAEQYGIAGLIIGLISLPLMFCCGILAPLGALTSLASLALGGMAVAQAKTARDPQQARTFGIISLVIGGIALLGSLAMMAFLALGLFGGSFFP
jgi:hypothetical protein